MDYKSKRWRTKRKRILKRDGYACQYHKRYGRRIDAVTVHHIYPAAEYPAYQWCDWNLISLSADAHDMMHDRANDRLSDIGIQLMRRTIPREPRKE